MTVPASIQSIQNVTITKGNSITLPCKAAGIPPPMVSWVKVSSGLRVYSNLLAMLPGMKQENIDVKLVMSVAMHQRQ